MGAGWDAMLEAEYLGRRVESLKRLVRKWKKRALEAEAKAKEKKS